MWKLLLGAHLVKKVDLLGTYAAALAYSFVLSVVPFMVVAFALTSQLVGTLNPRTYQHTLESILPLAENSPFLQHILTAVQTFGHNGWARGIGLLFAIYTSFNLMNQIVRTLVFILDDSRRPFEWSWKVFSKTVALLAVWTFLLLTLTISSVLGIFIYHNAAFLTRPLRVASDLGLIVSLFAAVFATFYLVPNKRPRLRDVRDGALVAAVGWIACSLVFADVLPRFLGANLVYQALGSIVIILLWSQSCAWSLIVGACWMVRFGARARR
jgi:YihY family inner membrane protein